MKNICKWGIPIIIGIIAGMLYHEKDWLTLGFFFLLYILLLIDGYKRL